jgi:eukaryotic-like serine/threonine-protein kinase
VQSVDADGLPPQSLMAGRYRVLGQLGRGGMARVYRVQDITTQRDVALKQLIVPLDEVRRRTTIAMFEREYHTLAQLAHPRVVEVYDCGLDVAGPYYTMELLDSGDLRDRSPIPWRTACELAFDVCSALALVHSRRLVHRDLSPRNVRCTRSQHAKLIDFGALAPVGPNNQVVGTPSFIAPEALHGATLDARTDLYSLGATLYFTLTGRAPYPAREIADLTQAWRTRPSVPSTWAEVPPELDALIMTLLSLDPTSRPPSAFEVMQRLASIATLDRNEPLSVSSAYLVTPTLVGREETLARFRGRLTLSLAGRGSGLFVEAGPGLGRSRLLDACVMEAKTAGSTALRVGACDGPFAAARVLSQHLLDASPQLALAAARDEGVVEILFAAAGVTPALAPSTSAQLRGWNPAPGDELELQTSLARWFLAVSQRQALLIAVDDVDRVDPQSLALLAALADRARSRRLLLCMTADSASLVAEPGLAILAGRCERVPLQPLGAAETEALLTSLFGDAANLSLLSERIHALANGRPRECMALAQHLVDRNLITYTAGIWTLPEQVTEADLPSSVEEVFRQRVNALSPGARRLAEAHALATFATLTVDDYARLEPEASVQSIHDYIDELIAHHIASGDGQQYIDASDCSQRVARIGGRGRTSRPSSSPGGFVLAERHISACRRATPARG